MTLKRYDPQEHVFDETIEVRLRGYRCIHRVHSICYGRNPNGVGRKKLCYAISDWKRDGFETWRECGDLGTAMNLAYFLDHPLPKNKDRIVQERAHGEILNQST